MEEKKMVKKEKRRIFSAFPSIEERVRYRGTLKGMR